MAGIPGKGRVGKEESKRRLRAVVEWYSLGYTISQIIHMATDWDISRRALEEYMSKAREQIAEQNRPIMQESANLILANQWHLYRTCVAKNPNAAIARNILMDIAKLSGLLAVRAEQANKLELPPELEFLSNEELEKRIKNAG